MALIRCPECSNEISDNATGCPKCGYPIQSATPQPPKNDLDALLKETLARDGKISAIKLYRERTSAGLAEAKNYVERLEAGLPPGEAGPPGAAGKPRGCFSLI